MKMVKLRLRSEEESKRTGVPQYVEMNDATTAAYAAKRVAEALGLDPDLPWRLIIDRDEIPDDELVYPYDGMRARLTMSRG